MDLGEKFRLKTNIRTRGEGERVEGKERGGAHVAQCQVGDFYVLCVCGGGGVKMNF